MIEIYIYIYINIELLFNTVCIIVPFSLWLQIYPNIYLCLFPSHQVLRQMCLRSASAMDWSCASGWDFVFFSLNLLKPSQETTLFWKWHVYVYNAHVGCVSNQFGPKPGIRCHRSTIPQMDLFAIIPVTKSCWHLLFIDFIEFSSVACEIVARHTVDPEDGHVVDCFWRIVFV